MSGVIWFVMSSVCYPNRRWGGTILLVAARGQRTMRPIMRCTHSRVVGLMMKVVVVGHIVVCTCQRCGCATCISDVEF